MKRLISIVLLLFFIVGFGQDCSNLNENEIDFNEKITELWQKFKSAEASFQSENENLDHLISQRAGNNDILDAYKKLDESKSALVKILKERDKLKSLSPLVSEAIQKCLTDNLDSDFFEKTIDAYLGVTDSDILNSVDLTEPADECTAGDETEELAYKQLKDWANKSTEKFYEITDAKEVLSNAENTYDQIDADNKAQKEAAKLVADSAKARVDELFKERKEIEDKILLSKNFYKAQYEIEEDKLDCFAKRENKIEPKKEETIKELTLIGGELFTEKDLFTDDRRNKLITKLLEQESENHLGNIIIPKKGDKIHLFSKEGSNNYKREEELYATFKSLTIEFLEGTINDILITLIYNGREVYFTNKYPIALLNFSKRGASNFMHAVLKKSIDIKELDGDPTDYLTLGKKFIRLTDVLLYKYEPGENYVPANLTLTLPVENNLENNRIQQNEESKVSYKVIDDTRLQNVIDLRAYSDFLGLFGEEENGIVNIEAKAEFFIFPFRFYNSRNYFFKKISPSVRYSRIDEENRRIDYHPSGEVDTIARPLDLLQRSFLHFGAETDVYSTQFKYFPLDVKVKFGANYYVTKIQTGANIEDTDNFQTVGFHSTFNTHFKRYNNFGLDLKLRLEWLNSRLQNDLMVIREDESLVSLKPPDNYFTLTTEFEAYWFPNKRKNNRFFTRLGITQDLSEDLNHEFFNFQFGYSFSLGINALKAK